MPPPLRARDLIRRLAEAGVEFVLIGGVAVNFHGHIYSTLDIDFCIRMDRANILRVLEAIRDLKPTQRMHPNRPPLPPDLAEMEGLRNFYVETTAGWIDFLSVVDGVGDFDAAWGQSVEGVVGGVPCRVLNLEALINAKRAADRPKDRLAVTQLEAIRKLREEMKGDDSGGSPL